MKTPFISFLFVTFSLYAFGGDSSMYAVVGFSKDGKYFAFERYGTHDGSGFPYAEMFFLDVCKNDYANAPLRITLEDEGSTEDHARAANLKSAKSILVKLGIDTSIKGTQSLQGNSSAARTIPFSFEGERMQLTLDVIETRNPECTDRDAKESMFILSLTRKGATSHLQRDTKVPKSRSCAFGYTVYGIHCYNNAIAVIIGYNTPGFEGPDTRQIAVSGCMK